MHKRRCPSADTRIANANMFARGVVFALQLAAPEQSRLNDTIEGADVGGNGEAGVTGPDIPLQSGFSIHTLATTCS